MTIGTETLWHPFAAMESVKRAQTVITRAEDVWLWDSAGTRYLDATASLWYANAGHGRREIADAVAAQLQKLDAYHLFTDFANEPALALADALAARAPMAAAKVFLTSGGGDSIDTAAKIARAHFALTGQPERTILLHREHSYHGTHGLGTSLAGIPGNRVAPPFVPDVVQTAWNDAEMLEETIRELGPEKVAAFFCEPVIGAGGVLPPPPGYVEAAAEVCARHGVLFVVDAVICGFGRLGDWFGTARFGITPDLITFAKGVTSGVQPLGGVVASGAVAAPFWDTPATVFRHGQTYSGHPAACAAGLATIDLYERDGLFARADALEGPLLERLQGLADHPLVVEARGGTGFLGALELVPDRPGLTGTVANAVREHGVIIRPMVSALGFSPPLTATEDHLDLLADAVRKGLDDASR